MFVFSVLNRLNGDHLANLLSNTNECMFIRWHRMLTNRIVTSKITRIQSRKVGRLKPTFITVTIAEYSRTIGARNEIPEKVMQSWLSMCSGIYTPIPTQQLTVYKKWKPLQWVDCVLFFLFVIFIYIYIYDSNRFHSDILYDLKFMGKGSDCPHLSRVVCATL